MNFVIVKKNLFGIKNLLGLLVLCFCYTGTMILAENRNTQFQEEERLYVDTLASEIEEIFEFFSDNVDKFMSASDHTPYRRLVLAMSDKLAEFEKRVMTTLAKKLIEAKAKNNEIFTQSLSIVQEVLAEFMTKINVLRAILVKPEYLNAHDGLQAIKLGKELEKYCKDLLDGKIITQLEVKIDKVYSLISLSGDKSLIEQLAKIKAGLKVVRNATAQKKSGGNELKIVNGIAAKIRHNK